MLRPFTSEPLCNMIYPQFLNSPSVVSAQAISSRPDLVPPSYTRELEKLQDKIPPFSDAEALLIIQQELGLPPLQLFSEFSPTSVAAASLGQVRVCSTIQHTANILAV